MKEKEVNIFGTKYRIIYANRVEDVEEAKELLEEGEALWGITDHDNKLIVVSTKNLAGKPRAKEDIEITLYHELVHALLVSGQYLTCNSDEPLVEWLARCMYTMKQQKIL